MHFLLIFLENWAKLKDKKLIHLKKGDHSQNTMMLIMLNLHITNVMELVLISVWQEMTIVMRYSKTMPLSMKKYVPYHNDILILRDIVILFSVIIMICYFYLSSN